MAICRPATEESLQKDCWRVLDQCMQQIEADALQDRLLEATVQLFMDMILKRVSRDPSTHAQDIQAHSLPSRHWLVANMMLCRWSVVLKRKQILRVGLLPLPRSKVAKEKVQLAANC